MSNEQNPFADANPFADPSIQRATTNIQQTQQSLDDYNPFSKQNIQSRPAAIIPTAQTYQATTTQPDQVRVEEKAPPPYAKSSAQTLNINEIERQQQELERRAAELDRREQMLNSSTGNIVVNNFPPFPSWCPGPLKPCFYQDITREIPVEFQKWVRVMFYLWIFHVFTLGFNVIAALVVFITTDKGISFALSIFYFIIFSPLSYVCWFRPVYKAFRNDSSTNFMVFFFLFFLQCIISVFACFGYEWFCGLILLISILSTKGVGNIVAGIFVLLTTIFFIVIAASDILMLIKIHRLYRNTGASFEKAQAEFATNVMSNRNVQNAAAAVVTEGARSAMQRQSGRF